jgi:hypothetical protein
MGAATFTRMTSSRNILGRISLTRVRHSSKTQQIGIQSNATEQNATEQNAAEQNTTQQNVTQQNASQQNSTYQNSSKILVFFCPKKCFA